MRINLALFFSLALLCACAKDKQGAKPAGPSGSLAAPAVVNAGPLDGKWKEVDILCDGKSVLAGPDGALKQFVASSLNAPNELTATFGLNAISQSQKINNGACTVTTHATPAYSEGVTGTSYVANPSVPTTCDPPACGGASCGAVFTTPLQVKYSLDQTKKELFVTISGLQGCGQLQQAKFVPVP